MFSPRILWGSEEAAKVVTSYHYPSLYCCSFQLLLLDISNNQITYRQKPNSQFVLLVKSVAPIINIMATHLYLKITVSNYNNYIVSMMIYIM